MPKSPTSTRKNHLLNCQVARPIFLIRPYDFEHFRREIVTGIFKKQRVGSKFWNKPARPERPHLSTSRSSQIPSRHIFVTRGRFHGRVAKDLKDAVTKPRRDQSKTWKKWKTQETKLPTCQCVTSGACGPWSSELGCMKDKKWRNSALQKSHNANGQSYSGHTSKTDEETKICLHRLWRFWRENRTCRTKEEGRWAWAEMSRPLEKRINEAEMPQSPPELTKQRQKGWEKIRPPFPALSCCFMLFQSWVRWRYPSSLCSFCQTIFRLDEVNIF